MNICRQTDVNRLQAAMQLANNEELPILHRFTPGLYSRTMTPEKGILIVSRIHKTEHQWVLSKGKVSVWTENGLETLSAPHLGITTPGTRRVILVHEDCVWTTFHPTSLTDVKEIEDAILEPLNPIEIEPFIVKELEAVCHP